MKRLPLALFVVVLAGCGGGGDSDSSDPQSAAKRERVTVADKGGDPEDGNSKRYPTRRELDLRRVVVERTADGLRIAWETAAPAKPPQIYVFSYYDEARSRGGRVEVRKRGDGSVGANASVLANPAITEITPRAIRFQGRRLTLDVPSEVLADLPSFWWQAVVGTIGSNPSIEDALPDVGEDAVNPKLAKFP